jgi:Protein of unknown function (DUF3800)
MAAKRRKLFLYVDESGQDDASQFFVVSTVVTEHEQDLIRRQLLEIEAESKTRGLKWQQSRHDRRVKYLTLVLNRKVAAGCVYIGRYPKPVPYTPPLTYVIEHAVKDRGEAKGYYRAIVRVDGINRKGAIALTNALRAQGVSLELVKGKTDEGEPLIRLADMWAGCIRSALLGEHDSEVLFTRAKESGYLKEVTA